MGGLEDWARGRGRVTREGLQQVLAGNGGALAAMALG